MASERVGFLTAPLSVAMTTEDRLAVRRAAFLSDVSVSALIREAATKAAARIIAKHERSTAERAA